MNQILNTYIFLFIIIYTIRISYFSFRYFSKYLNELRDMNFSYYSANSVNSYYSANTDPRRL